MTVSTFQRTNFQTQLGTEYVAAIDADMAVLSRLGGMFAPHAQPYPDMTVVLDAGHVLQGATLLEIPEQVTPTLTAPTMHPRIDRIVVDKATGAASVVAGMEATPPAPPALPMGVFPIAQVLLQPDTVGIANTMIMDERNFTAVDDFGWRPVQTITGENHTYTAAQQNHYVRRANTGSAMADVLPAGMPSGWVLTIANADAAALLSIAAEAGVSLHGAALGYLVLAPGQQATVLFDGTEYHVVEAPDRVKLASDTTLYVSTTGDDGNTGIAAAVPFLTIQQAVDTVADYFDLGGYTLTIQLADGTYTTGCVVNKRWVGGCPNDVFLSGNETMPSSVLLSTSDTVIWATGAGTGIVFQHMKVQSTSHVCILANNHANLDFGNVVFGNGGEYHMKAYQCASIYAYSDYEIDGGAGCHVWAGMNGAVLLENKTITISGTPAFPHVFANPMGNGGISIYGTTFLGSATGPRYMAESNGVIFTANAGPNFLPGDVDGSTKTGGQYV